MLTTFTRESPTVVTRQGKVLDSGIAKTGGSEHHHCVGGQQIRSRIDPTSGTDRSESDSNDLVWRRAFDTEPPNTLLPQDAERYAAEENLLFLETSAKNSENVSELFSMIARKLPLEAASNAGRAGGGAGGRGGSSITGAGGRAAGVDLRGGQGQNQDACNC